ncbi:hypothetical protein [Hymenobacter sp. YC55]|uniref:hypothetical protein n=1 Tax=Hymenobacter sp. YC55 TaxID=3034019 RepID=UPI0023F64DF4|nr:hypothetical protein [Hymenobacter sp. YC55]MDF7810489.1 hypothetical protein [Hymenobacter sp. YC55]
MFFPRSGTWGTVYQPLLWHFFKEDGTRLCDGSSEVQYTPSRAPRHGLRCEKCRQFARERRKAYGWANAGTDGRSEHWPPLQGPAY